MDRIMAFLDLMAIAMLSLHVVQVIVTIIQWSGMSDVERGLHELRIWPVFSMIACIAWILT